MLQTMCAFILGLNPIGTVALRLATALVRFVDIFMSSFMTGGNLSECLLHERNERFMGTRLTLF